MPDAKPPATLAEALAALQGQLPHVAKDKLAKITSARTGTTFTYKFAEFADICESLFPVMGDLGLSFSARPTMGDHGFGLAWSLRHVSGESDDGWWPLPSPVEKTPQDVAAAIGWARRACLLASTGLAPAGEEDSQQAFIDAVRAERADRAAERSGSGSTPAQAKAAASRKRSGQVDKDKMTNAERRDAGLMDRQQAAEHERAAALPPSRPADRGGKLEVDPWEGRPPEERENAPGTANPGQTYAIWTLLKKQGITAEDTAHGMAYVALGLPEDALKITDEKTGELRDSFKALSCAQAAEFIRQLQDRGPS